MGERRAVQQWVPWSGVAATVGAILWATMPWFQLATLGTRPYVATAFDVVAFAGWLLMAAGLVGFRAVFRDRYGRLGRVGVGGVGVGMALVALVLGRSAAAFVAAGFQAVPATGSDPAELVVTLTMVLGLVLAFGGAATLGVALWRLDRRLRLTSGLLVAGAVVPALAVVLRYLSLLPVPVGMALVRTNLVFVPFTVGWLAFGRLVWRTARGASGEP